MTIWEEYLDKKILPSLSENIETTTLIIGGGITGLTTLYYLNNVNTILVESNQIGYGVTKGTTGKLTFLQEDILNKLLKKDINIALSYLQSQMKAIKLIKDIIKKENIACNFEKSSSFLIATNKKEREKLITLAKFLKFANVDINSITEKDTFALKTDETYVFNPLKYLNYLKNKLAKQIYENTKIIDITKNKGYYYAKTSDNKIIKCKNIVIACHYPFFLKPLFLPLNTTIEKSYIIVKEEKENKHYNYITFKKPVLSFRYFEDNNKVYGIYLGKSHNTCYSNNDNNIKKVQKIFKIKDSEVLYKWTNVDLKTNDYIPYIGKIKNNMYIATGFNTWGMTNSIIGAYLISNLINVGKSEYQELFNPKRKRKYLKFYYSVYSNIIAFVKGFNKNKIWYKNISFKNVNGQRIGIYTDEAGKKHQVVAICPHLKCPLEFNAIDKTWDCPCHSSRFDIDGKCLKGPSKFNIKFR